MRLRVILDCHSKTLRQTPALDALVFGAVACGLIFAAPHATYADQIVIDGVSRAPVTLERMEEGRLHFRTSDGKPMSAWIDDIQRLTVDRGGVFTDFNEAERNLASGDADRAIVRYRRTMRLSDSFWPEFIAARLVQACERGDRIDQAALHFVRVLRGEFAGPRLATRLIPQRIPKRRDAKTVRAIEHLEGALRVAPNMEERVTLELFRYALMHESGDKRMTSAARDVATLEIPTELRFPRAYAVQLDALRQALRDAADASLMKSLDRAIGDCPRTLLPPLLLLKGETLLRTATTREEFVRASWPLMRVAIHLPDDRHAPRALVGAARALVGIGNKRKAIELLEESLAHAGIDRETGADAQDLIVKLRGNRAGATRPAQASSN